MHFKDVQLFDVPTVIVTNLFFTEIVFLKASKNISALFNKAEIFLQSYSTRVRTKLHRTTINNS